MATRKAWTTDQLLVILRLYIGTDFGKLHRNNPEIIRLGQLIGRTPSAIAMKAVNFASFDPLQKARNISGLKNASRADRVLWESFESNSEEIAAQAEEAYERLSPQLYKEAETELKIPKGSTEVERIVRTRRVQGFFRAAVLTSYNFRCALSDIAIPDLINASHIIPWSVSEERRADPRNGIALNALYDRAFDKGLITFDSSMRLVISPRLRDPNSPMFQKTTLIEMEGQKLRRPYRFSPDPEALAYHRENIFED